MDKLSTYETLLKLRKNNKNTIDENYDQLLNEFCSNYNLPFNDKGLLKIAFTHSSFANEHKIFNNNERLEFLGDGVLEIVARDYLYKNNINLNEGELTKLKESYVDNHANYNHAKLVEIHKYLRLGNGVNNDNTTILGDAFEALIGAIYLDLGFTYVYDFLVTKIFPYVNDDKHSYKNELQEIFTQNKIEYVITNEYGEQHDKTFDVDVYIDGIKRGSGSGKRIKDAEKSAAKDALEKEAVIKANESLENFGFHLSSEENYNYKGKLHQLLPNKIIKFELVNEYGEPHDKTFIVELFIDNIKQGSGTGRRKKDAEQCAAKDALKNLNSL